MLAKHLSCKIYKLLEMLFQLLIAPATTNNCTWLAELYQRPKPFGADPVAPSGNNQILSAATSIMRAALADPRLRPSAAVRSASNGSRRSTVLPPALPFPAARLRLSHPPESSPPTTRRSRPMPPPTANAAAGGSGGVSSPELTCPADFAAVAATGGRISVVGFGSLLSGERIATCSRW